jgi:hypothetical protein
MGHFDLITGMENDGEKGEMTLKREGRAEEAPNLTLELSGVFKSGGIV